MGENPAPPLLAPPDQAAIEETAEYLIEGCDFAAAETGYPGFKAKKEEALRVSKRIERVMALYTDRFNGPTTVWAFAIGSVSLFVGKRLLGFKKYQIEQYEKATQGQVQGGVVPNVGPATVQT